MIYRSKAAPTRSILYPPSAGLTVGNSCCDHGDGDCVLDAGDNVTVVGDIPLKKVTVVGDIPLKKVTSVCDIPLKKVTAVGDIPLKKVTVVGDIPLKKVTVVGDIPLKKVTVVGDTPLKKVTGRTRRKPKEDEREEVNEPKKVDDDSTPTTKIAHEWFDESLFPELSDCDIDTVNIAIRNRRIHNRVAPNDLRKSDVDGAAVDDDYLVNLSKPANRKWKSLGIICERFRLGVARVHYWTRYNRLRSSLRYGVKHSGG